MFVLVITLAATLSAVSAEGAWDDDQVILPEKSVQKYLNLGSGLDQLVVNGEIGRVIRRRNGRWYASIACWKPPMAPPRRETQSAGGVDVGISPLAMDSDGVEYQNPQAYGNE